MCGDWKLNVMKCLVCGAFSWKAICAVCLEQVPLTPRHRILSYDTKVYSFYRYDDVAYLMQSKYHLVGSRILRCLSQKAAKYFFAQGELPFKADAVALDDYPYTFYSHTGVILKTFADASQGKLTPIFGSLKARNNVKYAGQSLAFRQSHPKKFDYNGKSQDVVIFDDIITTGTSLNEAIAVLHKHQSRVLFCLTLCDAKA